MRVTNTTLTSVSEQCGTRPKKGGGVQVAACGGETGANSDVETDHGESVGILRSGVERAMGVSGSFLQHLMRLGSPSLPPHLPLRPPRVLRGDREQQPRVEEVCSILCDNFGRLMITRSVTIIESVDSNVGIARTRNI